MEINKHAKYEGYIWWSDQAEPRSFHGEEFDVESITNEINPFVIEGQLWNAEEGVSVSIRYADGKHIICFHKVTDEDLKADNNTNTLECYIPHRIDGTSKLWFLRYWKAEKDDFCENFETLIPEKLVFVGFDKK